MLRGTGYFLSGSGDVGFKDAPKSMGFGVLIGTVSEVSNSKKGSDISEPLVRYPPGFARGDMLTTIPNGVDFSGAAYGAT